jgi:hypothetical protein
MCGCPNQEIGRPFLYKGLIIETHYSFGADSATWNKSCYLAPAAESSMQKVPVPNTLSPQTCRHSGCGTTGNRAGHTRGERGVRGQQHQHQHQHWHYWEHCRKHPKPYIDGAPRGTPPPHWPGQLLSRTVRRWQAGEKLIFSSCHCLI